MKTLKQVIASQSPRVKKMIKKEVAKLKAKK